MRTADGRKSSEFGVKAGIDVMIESGVPGRDAGFFYFFDKFLLIVLDKFVHSRHILYKSCQ
jgi:hypothetical protein